MLHVLSFRASVCRQYGHLCIGFLRVWTSCALLAVVPCFRHLSRILSVWTLFLCFVDTHCDAWFGLCWAHLPVCVDTHSGTIVLPSNLHHFVNTRCNLLPILLWHLVCRVDDYWLGYKLFCYAYYSRSVQHEAEFRESKLGACFFPPSCFVCHSLWDSLPFPMPSTSTFIVPLMAARMLP